MDPQIIDGYTVVGLLGKGGRGTVYKVLHPQTRQPLGLKLLRTPELLPLEEQRFAREFNLAQSIVHDNVVRVFDVGRWEGSPYYTMELVEGTNLRAWTEMRPPVGAPERRRWFEQMATITDQIFNALACIHEKKIIHRDLKPENILVAPGPNAKIVDFGLAKVKAADQRLTGRGEVIGTASYAAPEILLRQEVDSRADLYAMGVILYECISGRVLFEGEEALGTLAQILYQEPSPLRTIAGDVPAELEAAIMKLLRKDPWDRTGTANEARQELAAAFRKVAGAVQPATARSSGGGVAVGPPPAPHVHSTSDIFEPRMVGRGVHLEMLLQVVDEAKRGEFRLVKIHGESGVGKSRLLTEFVRRASQKGHQAVWSRVYEDDPTPFRAIVPWLRQLSRSQQGSDSSSVLLKEAMEWVRPNFSSQETLTSFFGAGSISMQQTPMDRFRLFEMATRQVRSLLENGPALFVIEDLQWADAYSVEMLEYIVSSMTSDSASGPAAVIVATIREEEESRNQAMVKWFKTLSPTAWMIDMPVTRLKESEVEEMVRSMLGASQAPRELSEVVYRETEGNPFFVGELLKALVAHGALAQDGDGWLLKDEEHNRILSPGGASAAGILPPTVQEAILQRLRKLPVMHREILQHAAIMGQVFSFDQVRASTAMDPIQMVDALEELATLRVLAEVPQANTPHYSFYHNKIREVLLSSMRAEQVQDIHLKVGVALENEQKKLPSSAGVFQLAFHFSRSGVWYRAKPYLMAAADNAMKGFAFSDAADYYKQVLEAHHKDRILSPEEVYAVQEARAEALDASGQHVDAEVLFRQLVKAVPKGPNADLMRARLERKLARVHHAAGSYEEALKHFDQGLIALGIKVPKKGLGSALHRLGNYVRARTPALARKVPDVRRSQEILELCDGIIQTIYFMDPGGHLHHIWNAAFIYKQIATQGKDDADLATSEFLMAYLYCMHDNSRLVHKSLQKTLDVLQRMEDSPRKARLLRECGLLYYMLGWFNEALHYVTQGRELASQIADVTGLAWASITESNVRWLQGDLEAAMHLSQQAIQVATTTQMKSVWAIGQSLLARQKMSAGDLEEPQRLLEAMRRVAPGGTNRFEDLLSDLAYGMLRRREGRLSEAAALLQQAERGFTAARSGNNYVLEAGVELAEVFVAQATAGRGRSDYAIAELDKVVRRLEPLSRGIPVRRGAMLRLQAQLAGVKGQNKQALQLFQESQKLLEAGGYYVDLAQTYEAAGRWMETLGSGQGRRSLARAAELYRNIGAARRAEALEKS